MQLTVNGQPVNATLPQNQLGTASFYVDVPPLDVGQGFPAPLVTRGQASEVGWK